MPSWDAKTSTTAKVIWSLMKKKPEQEEGDQADVAQAMVVYWSCD
jgi:hypothetical protein